MLSRSARWLTASAAALAIVSAGPAAVASEQRQDPVRQEFSNEEVRAILRDITWGARNPWFSSGFADMIAAKAPSIRQHLAGRHGDPMGVRGMGGDHYVAFYREGFVEWELVRDPRGQIIAASYRIVRNPGTPVARGGTSDQRELYGFWTAMGEVASAYEAQRQAEIAHTNSVLALIAENGGYSNSGSGFGASGVLASPEALVSSASSYSGDDGAFAGTDVTSGTASTNAADRSNWSASTAAPPVQRIESDGSVNSSYGSSTAGAIIVASPPPPPPPPPDRKSVV